MERGNTQKEEVLSECLNPQTLKTKNYFVEYIFKYTKEYKCKHLFRMCKRNLQKLCYRVVSVYAND